MPLHVPSAGFDMSSIEHIHIHQAAFGCRLPSRGPVVPPFAKPPREVSGQFRDRWSTILYWHSSLIHVLQADQSILLPPPQKVEAPQQGPGKFREFSREFRRGWPEA